MRRSCGKIQSVGLGSVRIFQCAIVAMISALCAEYSLFAQQKAIAVKAQETPVSVPFIGCRSDGQAESSDAPNGTSISVRMSVRVAHQLAYYRSAQGVGVLGPRGWYCYGISGSSGDALFVSSQPIDPAITSLPLSG